ncbi:hypothetical protein FE257_007283 [Aspergillus nanangensis]|uniref:Uncharacterized protein n=1 Tax=Aspergillus nanangensis TaxID=2582783 RepID=A0AAD4GNQ4_ASPNN|nr:hypothetical protein FE257_007283 [Aspergillus nanangensis]
MALHPRPGDHPSNKGTYSKSGQTHLHQSCSLSNPPYHPRTDTSDDGTENCAVGDAAAPLRAPLPCRRSHAPTMPRRRISYTPSVYSSSGRRSSLDHGQGPSLQNDLAVLQRSNPFRQSRLPLSASHFGSLRTTPKPKPLASRLGLCGQQTLYSPQDFPPPTAERTDERAILYEVGSPAVIYRLPLARVTGLFNIYSRSHPGFWYAVWADNQLRAVEPAAVPGVLRANVVISGPGDCWARAQHGQFTSEQTRSRSSTWLDEVGYSQYFRGQR